MASKILMQRQQQNVEKLHQAILDQRYDAICQITDNSKDREKLCKCEKPPNGSSLHLAAKVGNLDIVKLILQHGVDVNIQQQDGHITARKTPLHEAAAHGKLDVVRYLIAQGADINATDSDGQTPLFMACRGRDINVVKHLVENGAEINMKDHKKNTPLLSSIIRSPTEVSVLLIQSGADVNGIDEEGQSSLHYASEWGNNDLVKLLLTKGTNINIQDKKGRTPLHIATDESTKSMLLQFGADANIRDKFGKPAVESQIDISKDEYQKINQALSKHQDMSSTRPAIQSSPEQAAQVQEKFNRLAIAGDEKVKEVKGGVMAELLLKAKNNADDS